VLPLDQQYSCLHPLFPREGGFFSFPLHLKGRIIRKEIELFKFDHLLSSSLDDDMIRRNVDPPDQKIFVHNLLKQPRNGIQEQLCRGGLSPKVRRTMRRFRDGASVAVSGDRPAIGFLYHRVSQTFNIISNRQNKLVCHELFIDQIECQQIGHFAHDQFREC
jgi:hypothetical protein